MLFEFKSDLFFFRKWDPNEGNSEPFTIFYYCPTLDAEASDFRLVWDVRRMWPVDGYKLLHLKLAAISWLMRPVLGLRPCWHRSVHDKPFFLHKQRIVLQKSLAQWQKVEEGFSLPLFASEAATFLMVVNSFMFTVSISITFLRRHISNWLRESNGRIQPYFVATS